MGFNYTPPPGVSGPFGSLRIGDPKTANFTLTPGELTPVNLQSLTANVSAILPNSPPEGTQCGFYVSAHSLTAGGSIFPAPPYWCIEPIPGGVFGIAHVSPATGGSQYAAFNLGESVIFVRVANTWVPISTRLKHECILEKTVAQSITNDLETPLTFGTTVTNVGGLFNSSSRIYVKRSGTYSVYANFTWAVGTGSRLVGIKKNGDWVSLERKVAQDNTETGVARLIEAEGGDYFEAYVYQASGGSLNIIAAMLGLREM